ncbi:MAG: DUF885 domain-containing protein [Acidobacteria bacterium]|nr:DUF885 domain-containing protein [Acidobacteriota bacterium]
MLAGCATTAPCDCLEETEIVVTPSVSGPATADPADHRDDELHGFFDAEWEWTLEEFPEFATYLGDRRYDDRVTDISAAAIERRKAHARDALARLKAIDRSRLSEADKLNYDLYLEDLENEIAGHRFPGEYLQINQMGGIHQSIAQIANVTPKRTVADVENFIRRLEAFPTSVDHTIEHLEAGLEKGVTPPRITLREVGNLIRLQMPDRVEDSPIYTIYFSDLPESIPESERERLRREGISALRQSVYPALRKLEDFWEKSYYGGTRESIGLSELPDGEAWYAYNVRQRTTTDLTPDQIHQIGLDEVARIRGEMEKIREETGFEGSLAEFFTFLRTDEQFFFDQKEDLLTAYRDIAKRIDGELPTLFRTLQRLPYTVEPVPEYSEKTQTTAYYNPGSIEAGRAGVFYANTYDLASRPKWEMEALTLHEAVPGHHLQIALAQELGELPNFRRYGFGYTAFVEGWGLYAESLGSDLGMYEDPYSKFGQLTYEMWRAIRLVVDTGMHSKGWSRQQAIEYFMENAGKSEHDVVVEIDRYIVWPGQALAYKIGELKIKELRQLASTELGENFDVREFHDTVLGAGAIPLSILERRVRDWIASKKEP